MRRSSARAGSWTGLKVNKVEHKVRQVGSQGLNKIFMDGISKRYVNKARWRSIVTGVLECQEGFVTVSKG